MPEHVLTLCQVRHRRMPLAPIGPASSLELIRARRHGKALPGGELILCIWRGGVCLRVWMSLCFGQPSLSEQKMVSPQPQLVTVSEFTTVLELMLLLEDCVTFVPPPPATDMTTKTTMRMTHMALAQAAIFP